MSKNKHSHELLPISKKLKALFERAYQAEDAYILTLVIYEIVGIYDLPVMEPIQTLIMAFYSDDVKPYKQLTDQTRKEIRDVYEKLEAYAIEHGIKAPSFLMELDCFKAVENLPVESGLTSISDQYSKIRFALFLLPQDCPNYYEFVGQFVEFNQNEISRFTFVPTLDVWEKERQRLDRIRPTSIWYSWDQVAHLYLLQDPKKAEESISIPEIKHCLHQLEDFTFEWLETQLTSRTVKSKKESYPTYQASESILKINGVSIDFEQKSIRASLLKCFFKNSKAQDKKFSLEEIYSKANREKIGHFTLERADKDAIYGARNGINSVVLEKVGINDFLVLEKSKISINPQYLK